MELFVQQKMKVFLAKSITKARQQFRMKIETTEHIKIGKISRERR